MERLSPFDEDRYLVIDDTVDDITEILTVICDGRPQAARSDLTDLIGGAS